MMIRNHLAKMPELANQPKADLSRGLTVAQVAEKHGWENCSNCCQAGADDAQLLTVVPAQIWIWAAARQDLTPFLPPNTSAITL